MRLKHKQILPSEAIKRKTGIFLHKHIGAYKQKNKHIFAPQIFPKEGKRPKLRHEKLPGIITFAAMIKNQQIMAAIDFSQFHELAEQFKGEIPLKKICEQEGVSYRSYITWRSREGLSPRRQRRNSMPGPSGMVEMISDCMPQTGPSPMANIVHIEFANGLKFDRSDMEVDALVEFLTKIRVALCLG